jgi:hypothetical protein
VSECGSIGVERFEHQGRKEREEKSLSFRADGRYVFRYAERCPDAFLDLLLPRRMRGIAFAKRGFHEIGVLVHGKPGGHDWRN